MPSTSTSCRVLLEETPERWRLLVRFLAETGLLVGQLIVLRWEDVDLGRVALACDGVSIGAGSTRRRAATEPADADLYRLAQYLWRDRAGAADDDPVFTRFEGRPLRSQFLLRSVVKPAARRAVVPWAEVHTLRHTCASILFARAGTPSRSRWCSATTRPPSPWRPTST